MMEASLGQKTGNIVTFIHLIVICKKCLCTIYISQKEQRLQHKSSEKIKSENKQQHSSFKLRKTKIKRVHTLQLIKIRG